MAQVGHPAPQGLALPVESVAPALDTIPTDRLAQSASEDVNLPQFGQRGQPILTAPSLRVEPLAETSVRNQRAADVQAHQQENPSSREDQIKAEDVPWVLSADQHPWPLRYQEPNFLPSLYLELPSVGQARLMLNGAAADEAEKARVAVSKFISDALGTGVQSRARQLNQLNDWIEKIESQLRLLSTDPWQRYQFLREVLPQVNAYLDRVHRQTQPSLIYMSNEIKAAIAQIKPVMEVMPTYELQMAFYMIMEQAQKGFALYQSRVAYHDSQLVGALDAFLKRHPPVMRPAGPAPARPGILTQAAPVQAPSLTAVASLSQKAERKPAPSLVEAGVEDPKAKNGSSVMGVIVLIVLVLITVGYLKFKKKLSPKESSVKT